MVVTQGYLRSREKRKEKEKRRRVRDLVATCSSRRKERCLCDAFLEAEHAWIEFKEGKDIFQGISFRVPQLLVLFPVIHDMIVSFEWNIATRACYWERTSFYTCQ